MQIIFLVGMETSHTVLCQAFLDFFHEPNLQKRLQDEIDSQFEPSHIITLKDRYLVFYYCIIDNKQIKRSI